MTLEEAIKELTDAANEAWDQDQEKRADTCELGIEALKQIQRIRAIEGNPDICWLPGETKK